MAKQKKAASLRQAQNEPADFKYVVAIDPTSGAKSKLGFAVYDTTTMKIVTMKEFSTPGKDLRERIKQLSAQLVKEFGVLEKLEEPYIIFFESTVMMGKGGESYQRAIGAYMAMTPNHRRLEEVSNMQVKMFVGGTGKADKEQVAAGLLSFFPDDQESLLDLIKAHRYDCLDALAIGVTGWEKFILKSRVLNR